jgi:hypothetical protein
MPVSTKTATPASWRFLAREAAPGVLHDVDGQAFARLGVERAAHFLVRPDGYVAYRSGSADLNGLQRYLAGWLPGAGAAPTAETSAGREQRRFTRACDQIEPKAAPRARSGHDIAFGQPL